MLGRYAPGTRRASGPVPVIADGKNMTLAIGIWIAGLTSLLLYFSNIAIGEPVGSRLLLWSYWFLFIFMPLVFFGAFMDFTLPSLVPGAIGVVVLAALGERGLRLWRKMWTRRHLNNDR